MCSTGRGRVSFELDNHIPGNNANRIGHTGRRLRHSRVRTQCRDGPEQNENSAEMRDEEAISRLICHIWLPEQKEPNNPAKPVRNDITHC
jgi:hypothetical protein